MRARPWAPEVMAVASCAVLAGMGVVMVYSTTASAGPEAPPPLRFLRQVVAMGCGVALATGVRLLPLEGWRRAAGPLWCVAMGLLFATHFAGTELGGARRWLEVPGLFVAQPAELARWSVLLASAALLAAENPGRWGGGMTAGAGCRVAVCVGAPAVALLLQPDTGGALLLLLLVTLLVFLAGLPLRHCAVGLGGAAAAVALAAATHPYVLDRLRSFSDPWQRAHAEGFQVVQSFVAFGRGGVFGVGLGDGRQKLFYLPHADTDFVLSVVAEELGLVGIALVLGATAALTAAGFRIALRAGNRFGALLAAAMTANLTLPAVLHAAVAMGLAPPTGLPFPFVSYGRSALLMSFMSLGLLLGVARCDPVSLRRIAAGATTPRGVVGSGR